MKDLSALDLKDNPCVRFISLYRKNLTAAIKTLASLDGRAILEVERLRAEAWKVGGKQGEKTARDEYYKKKTLQTKEFYKHAKMDEGERKKIRKENLKRLIAEARNEKEQLLDERADL